MMAAAHTLLAACPVCGSDAAEPRGIAGDMEDARVGVVVLCCGDCSLFYLSPDPGALGAVSLPPESPFSRRRIARWTAGLPARARIVIADSPEGRCLESFRRFAGAEWLCERLDVGNVPEEPGAAAFPGERGTAHLAVLPHSLESARRPDDLLRRVNSVLSPGGRVVLIAGNAGSSVFRMFGGRHWSGYARPGVRQIPGADAIRRLCRDTGFEIRAVYTLFAPGVWLSSLANGLTDWGAPRWLVTATTGRWLLPASVAAALEGVAVMRNRGSLLAVELEKS